MDSERRTQIFVCACARLFRAAIGNASADVSVYEMFNTTATTMPRSRNVIKIRGIIQR